MNKSRLIACLLVVCAVGFAVPAVSGGQLGGLIRKKIGEATKKDEPKKEEPTPAAPTAPTAPVGSSAEFNFSYPDISEPVLVGLELALEKEIALREDFKKELAAMKTPEQYNACTLQVKQSPEFMKIIEPMSKLTSGDKEIKQEELQKVMTDIGAKSDALTLKTCGPDPAQFNSSWRAKRLEEIHRKAAEAAGVVPQ